MANQADVGQALHGAGVNVSNLSVKDVGGLTAVYGSVKTEEEKKKLEQDEDERKRREELSDIDFPNKDEVTAEFACAMQKAILVQGTMYITNSAIYFFSTNIIGKKVKELMMFKDIVSLEKKKMLLIPNAIEIKTSDGSSFTFQMLLKRDEAFEQLQVLIGYQYYAILIIL